MAAAGPRRTFLQGDAEAMSYLATKSALGSDDGWFYVCFGLIALYGGIKTIAVRDTGEMRGKTGRVSRYRGRKAVVYGFYHLFSML